MEAFNPQMPQMSMLQLYATMLQGQCVVGQNAHQNARCQILAIAITVPALPVSVFYPHADSGPIHSGE